MQKKRQHGDDEHEMIQTVGFIGKHTISDHKAFIKELYTYLKSRKKTVICDEYTGKVLRQKKTYSKQEIMNECDLVFALGGDGTILKIAHAVGLKSPLLVSVNLGNVGFLTEIQPEKIQEFMEEIFKGNFIVDKRFLLRASLFRKGKKYKSFLSLNEVVINQGSFARLIKLRIDVDKRKMTTFHADGVIIATPTGSTAHSLSAGGPIIHPKIPGLVINPICPASLSMRPIIVPNDRQIKVYIDTQRRGEAEIGLTIDGQITEPVEFGDEIRIKKSRRSIRFARLTGKQYFRMLRKKLKWGGE